MSGTEIHDTGTSDRRIPIAAALSLEKTNRLSVEVWQIAQDWLAQAKRMQQFDAAFSAKLAASTSAVEAAETCGAWLGHRLDSAVVAQHRMLEAWLKAMAITDEANVAFDDNRPPARARNNCR